MGLSSRHECGQLTARHDHPQDKQPLPETLISGTCQDQVQLTRLQTSICILKTASWLSLIVKAHPGFLVEAQGGVQSVQATVNLKQGWPR